MFMMIWLDLLHNEVAFSNADPYVLGNIAGKCIHYSVTCDVFIELMCYHAGALVIVGVHDA